MVMVLVVTSYLRIRRKSKESKEIDDRIGQVFVYVIAGSNGFERVVVLRRSGWSEKRPSIIHDSAF